MSKVNEIRIFFFLLAACNSVHAQNSNDIINRYLDTVSLSQVDDWNNIRSAYVEKISFFDNHSYQHGPAFFNNEKPSYGKLQRLWPDLEREELYADSMFSQLTSTFLYLKKKHIITIGNLPPMEREPARFRLFEFITRKVIEMVKNDKNGVNTSRIRALPIAPEVTCYEIAVDNPSGPCLLYFNVDSYLLEAWYHRSGDYYQRFLDYRRFGNFLIPTNQFAIRNGAVFSSTRYTRIDLDVEFDKTAFKSEGQ